MGKAHPRGAFTLRELPQLPVPSNTHSSALAFECIDSGGVFGLPRAAVGSQRDQVYLSRCRVRLLKKMRENIQFLPKQQCNLQPAALYAKISSRIPHPETAK